MKIFNLDKINPSQAGKGPQELFYEVGSFKARVVQLAPGESIPECRMKAHVVFNVLSGSAEVTVNGKAGKISKGQCLITKPAVLSMKTDSGVKILGMQIKNGTQSGD